VPRAAPDVYRQRFTVAFEYPVVFARDVFAPENPLFTATLDRLGEGRRHRVVFYIDQGVTEAHPQLAQRIKDYCHAHPEQLELAAPPLAIVGGEAAKRGWEPVRDVMSTIGNLHLDRQSYVAAIGGGSVLDMVGFATSIVHRGLRLVRLPTTTLAQNDAGVGVKNGMDEHGQKNFVGTFAPPFAVINDSSFLQTLAPRDWIGGVAEAFKVAIIKDVAFFEFLCASASALRERRQDVMEQVVRRCAALHLDHIRTSGDPFEFGSARPLDFGHWSGHRIEVLSGYTVGHGQGAAIGIALDSYYAMRRRLIGKRAFARIITGLTDCGLPVWNELLERRSADGQLEILEGLNHFREHLGGVLTITLPDGIGTKTEVHHIDPGLVEEAVLYLKRHGDALV